MHILAIGTRGDNTYNNAAISDDAGNHFANMDSAGKSLSYETLRYAGINPGQSVKANGVNFTWPASNPGYYDNYQANGQVIPVTPVSNASTLAFLGLSTNGSSAGTATITYTDASTQNFTLGFTDWCNNKPQYGNAAIAVLPYHNTTAGKETGNCFIYYTETTLQPNKTVQSVTLPNSLTQGNGQLHVFSVGTRAGSYYNNIGTVDDDNPTLGNFDGQGNAFSQQALQSVGIQPGQIVSMHGINFTWPNVLSDPNAANNPNASISQFNNFAASGQTLAITPVNNATTLGFLGASIGGNQSGQLTITYTDGSTQTATLNMTDWTNTLGKGQLAANNQYGVSMNYRDALGGKNTSTTYFYYTDFALASGKILQSVSLPNQANIHIFAIGTRGNSVYNNVGVSDDAHPSFGSVDQGATTFSYSAQALQQAGLTPGQPFTTNGVTFIWPAVATGGQLDNYVANGQTIPVTPVDNANTIAFLGSGTNGSPAGTAVVNYSDGSHQNITLGFTDWASTTPANNNQIAASMPYHNQQTGKRTLTVNIYYVEYPLTVGKTVQSITLPQTVSTGQMHVFSISTRGAIFYNNIGTSDDANTKTGSFDGVNSYSAQALKSIGVQPNHAIYYNGITFTWASAAAGQFDNYSAIGQTIPVIPAPNATTLGFIGAANNGPVSGTATITYTDGSTQPFTLTMSDWNLGAGSGSVATGNQMIATMTYRNTPTGTQKINTYLFYTDVALQSGKTLKSITLPNQSNIHIFALGTRSASVYNNAATSTDASTSFVSLDTAEHSLSATALQTAGFVPGAPVNINGVTFTWPNVAFGQYDNYVASGQVIPVTPVNTANILAFIGTATNGATSGTAIITYTDGSTQTFTLGFTDWATPTPSFGNTIAAVLPYYNLVGGQSNATRYLYYAEVSLNAAKTVKSVTLPATVSPTTGQLHVFAVGTRSGVYYNNAGTSDDSNTNFGTYDSTGHSYSAQTLSAAGIVPNRTFYFNGSAFAWPNVAPGDYNNYTTNGQTIPVTPVANADTLAFIGSATNGPLSATATINYTDGSSQSFTLTMSDWALPGGITSVAQGNQIVTTLPYRNSPTGKDTTSTYLFYTDVFLQPGKSVQSVTLPNAFSTGIMHIFAIGSRAVTQYNNVGINDDNNPGFSASLDGGTASYSAEALQLQGLVPGQTFAYNGVNFTWPNTMGGQMDNYQANGQVIPVTPVSGATTLAFLGAGTDGSPQGTATITYTDGTTQNSTLALTDWATSPPAYGNQVAVTSSYYLNGMNQVSGSRYVFYTDITLQPGKTIQSIQLPTTITTGQMHIFAIGTK